MKNTVPKHSIIQKILLAMIVLAGVFPILYLVSVETGIAEGTNGSDSTDAAGAGAFERYVDNVAFGVGEKLEFDINYGFINAGSASIEVTRLIEYEGRPCYQIVSLANSNDFFSTFYRVDDRVETIVDALGIFPWRFQKVLSEGNYQSDRTYIFDQRHNNVFYEKDTIAVSAHVHDALSTLYYVRTLPLEVGKSYFLETFVDGRKISLEAKVLRKESVSVEAGNFDCLVVEPITESVGLFKSEGKLTVWLTDDFLKMPVLMKSKVLVGSISAELTNFELGEIRDF